MVVFRQTGCIWATVVLFVQKWLYSGKSSCIREKVVVSGQSVCIRAKVFIIGKNMVGFGQKWL